MGLWHWWGFSAAINHAQWMYAVTQRIILTEKWRISTWRFFTECLEKWKNKKEERKTEPYNSKELNHPADILGFHLGGSSAVVFCATDSQSVYGTLLSLDLCMFSPQIYFVIGRCKGWNIDWVGVCLSAQMRMNLSVFCVLFLFLSFFLFWLPSWFHLSVLPGRHKPLPSALDSKFLCIQNRR